MQSGDYKKDILIVVPYRDRKEHLSSFLKNVPSYFNNSNFSYDILICELDQVGDWNAGLCINSISYFLKNNKQYEWLYVHHVDIWPESGQWVLPKGEEIFYNLGDYGSCFLKMSTFFEVNGYCNSFWGWGGEDSEFYEKLTMRGYKLVDAQKMVEVKFNTYFQNHERKFNGNNYGGGLNLIYNKVEKERDNIKNFYEHATVQEKPNICGNIFHQVIKPLRKSPREHQNDKVLLGYIHGLTNFDHISPFIKSSLLYAPYSYDIVIIVSDDTVPSYLIDQLHSFGVKVVLDKKTVDNLYIDRFLKYKNFLNSSGNKYNTCLHVDVTDSYFQENPFTEIEKGLYMTSEGISIQDESWNSKMFEIVYDEEILNQIKSHDVLCNGVVGGDNREFINFCDKILEEYQKISNNAIGVDQIIVQKLVYYDKTITPSIKKPEDNYCINLHVYEFNKERLNFKLKIIDNKRVELLNQNKFKIVHQYNRNFEIYNKIINHFSNYFAPV